MKPNRETGAAREYDGAIASLVFEQSQDLVLVTDWNSVIVEVNPAWTRLMGWPREALIGTTTCHLTHADDLAALIETGETLRAQGSARHRFRVKTTTGEWRWVEGISQVVSPTRLMAILRDVTEERALATERARMTAQSDMLAQAVGVVRWTLDSATRTFTRSHPAPTHLGHAGRLTFGIDTFAEQFHPDDHALALKTIEHAMSDGVDGGYDARIRSADGGWLHFKVSFRCEQRDGRWIVHGLSQDVTGLVVARDTAQAAEAEARAVLETAPFASCIVGPDLNYISTSSAWRVLFAGRTEPYPGTEFGALLPRSMKRRIQTAVKRALAGEVYTRSEEVVERRDGAVILRWQARPWRAPCGEIRGAIIYASDITDMVLAGRTARANAKRLRLALDAADASVFEIDYANKTFWAGQGFSKLAGRALNFDEAVHLWPTVHDDDRARVRAEIDAFDTHNPSPVDARMVGADGTRWARAHMRIQHDAQGRPRRAIGLIQDIDAQKRQALALEVAERQAQVAAEAKSNFLANVSHEIRTPMNGVLGVMQLIKRDHLDAEEQRLLDEALASGRMLTEMLDDLLDFSKIETGQFELHPEALDPTAVLVGVASLLEPAASAKGLKMTAVAAPDVGLVKADPLRLRQALYNIMGNAVKFTPQGSIEARLTRHVDEKGAQRLRFEVQDTGIGVAEDFQATLFERFEQADSSSTRKHGGSGLGLAITKRLAEMMGGAVGFSSTPGQGSTFWIEIDGETVEPTEVTQIDEPDIGEFRVLLVEDNPTNRLVISKILEALGVQVDTAEDGAQGVELAARGGYDLVLMDIQMPGMDGIEATRRIRAMDGAKGSTPIVAVTANVMADQRTSYADAGMNGVVAKPVSAGALIAEIARVTERTSAAA